jgi:long-subunit fatty acid transport protein
MFSSLIGTIILIQTFGAGFSYGPLIWLNQSRNHFKPTTSVGIFITYKQLEGSYAYGKLSHQDLIGYALHYHGYSFLWNYPFYQQDAWFFSFGVGLNYSFLDRSFQNLKEEGYVWGVLYQLKCRYSFKKRNLPDVFIKTILKELIETRLKEGLLIENHNFLLATELGFNFNLK